MSAPDEPRRSRPAGRRNEFALHLTAKERHAIRKAAGSAEASKFARNLLFAAARKDEAAVQAIMKEDQAAA